MPTPQDQDSLDQLLEQIRRMKERRHEQPDNQPQEQPQPAAAEPSDSSFSDEDLPGQEENPPAADAHKEQLPTEPETADSFDPASNLKPDPDFEAKLARLQSRPDDDEPLVIQNRAETICTNVYGCFAEEELNSQEEPAQTPPPSKGRSFWLRLLAAVMTFLIMGLAFYLALELSKSNRIEFPRTELEGDAVEPSMNQEEISWEDEDEITGETKPLPEFFDPPAEEETASEPDEPSLPSDEKWSETAPPPPLPPETSSKEPPSRPKPEPSSKPEISSKPEPASKEEPPSKEEESSKPKPEPPSKEEESSKPKPEPSSKPEISSKPEPSSKPESSSKPEPSSKPDKPEQKKWDDVLVIYKGTKQKMAGADAVNIWMSNEINNSFPLEAAKAQALSVYTYLKRYTMSGSYVNIGSKTPQKPGTTIYKAIQAVEGKAIYEKNGQIAFTPWFSCSIGVTLPSEQVWGGTVSNLKSTDSSIEIGNHLFAWCPYEVTRTYTKDEMRGILEGKTGFKLSDHPENWIVVKSYYQTVKYKGETIGYVNSCTIDGHDQTESGRRITGRYLREGVFGSRMRSTAFRVSYDAKSETFSMTCYGYGHGCGLSQVGACLYAKEGWSYDKILKHYYKGIQIQ